MSNDVRTYGKAPYNIVLVHGGPGATGDLAPLAHALASKYGIVEALQTARSLEGQIEELQQQIRTHGDLPVRLVGHSWGAWLAWLCAAKYPELVRKLILINSGPFEESYAEGVMELRFSRLDEAEKAELMPLLEKVGIPDLILNPDEQARFMAFFKKTDSYAYEAEADDPATFDLEIFRGVWPAAHAKRIDGSLLRMADQIPCPVVAIHGDYDPHPAAGVEEPLSKALDSFRMIVLEKCGHYPWRERWAREQFLRLLSNELQSPPSMR